MIRITNPSTGSPRSDDAGPLHRPSIVSSCN
jgi:hypothetical protein